MYTEKRNLKRLGMVAAIAIIALIFAAQASAADNDPEVRVDAPDWTITAFDAIITMEYFDDGIKDLEGEFDLSFDTDVVEVVDDPKSVTGMKIKNKVVSIEWEFVEGSDNKKIHVEFIIPDDTDTRTYGKFVKIHFDLVGDTGDSSLLDISDGSLYKDETPVSAKWTGDTINIESFDVVVNAPEFVSTDTFDASIGITDVVDLESAAFILSFDPGVVNVTNVQPGKISGTEVPVDGWEFKDGKNNTIVVTSNLPGTDGVSGSGTLAVITFDVIGADGCSSVLDIGVDSNTGITNIETDRLPINWIDANVTINSEAPQSLSDTDTTVFVKNLDDDKLTVFLYIDGNYIDDKDVSSGSTKEYSTYKLVEGPHTFKIKWYDLDTKTEHEKVEERSVSGDTDVVVLYTVEHADEDTEISARVYVKNNDDDPVDVFLHIDGTYKKCETIEAGDTCDYEEDGYEFDEKESHTFEIKWIDPDTDVEYEKITRRYIETAESVTMQVDSHTEDDLITTTSVPASDSSSSKSPSLQSRSAPATSAALDTSAGSGTSTSESESSTTALQTDPASAGSDDNSSGSGAGDSQPYQHLYSLVGVVAIVFAMMHIRRV
ncbi:MAG: cohesin domain-containing protein [Candidatus Methanogasteraceae archaeon]